MKFTFNKKEKLKSKKLIESLFSKGQSVSAFPLRLVYTSVHFDDGVLFKTGVSVSKKHFKQVNIGASIDGVGDLQYYMRPPSRFNKIHENLLKVSKVR